MVSLKYCKKQKRGIKILKPNDNLSKEYIESAKETLSLLKEIKNKSNMWAATTKYYFEYFLVYSFLIKCGIKCEIHDCTIKLCEILESKGFLPKDTAKILEKDKELRIDNQYYLKNKKVNLDFEKLTSFYLEIKNAIESLTFEEINKIRKIIG